MAINYDKHSFTVGVAEKVGIASAILLDNIAYWVEHNAVKGINFHDGKFWTYNSKKAYSTLMPYMTERQVKYALEQLKKDGYVVTGVYNAEKFDRTLWYTLSDKAIEEFYPWVSDILALALGEIGQGILDENVQGTLDEIDRPIPYINNKPNINTNISIGGYGGKTLENPTKKKYSNGLDDPNKVRRTDSVAFTEAEYQKLIKKFGSEEELLSYIDWFGSEKDYYEYVYASDYRATINWGYDGYFKRKRIAAKERPKYNIDPLSAEKDKAIAREVKSSVGMEWRYIRWSAPEIEAAVKKVGYSKLLSSTAKDLEKMYIPQIISLVREYERNGIPK